MTAALRTNVKVLLPFFQQLSMYNCSLSQRYGFSVSFLSPSLNGRGSGTPSVDNFKNGAQTMSNDVPSRGDLSLAPTTTSYRLPCFPHNLSLIQMPKEVHHSLVKKRSRRYVIQSCVSSIVTEGLAIDPFHARVRSLLISCSVSRSCTMQLAWTNSS